jgi:hypothetical protein
VAGFTFGFREDINTTARKIRVLVTTSPDACAEGVIEITRMSTLLHLGIPGTPARDYQVQVGRLTQLLYDSLHRKSWSLWSVIEAF